MLKTTIRKKSIHHICILLLLIFSINNYSQNILKISIDTDKDGVSDAIDIDDDNDGILDKIESSYKKIESATANGSPLFTLNKGVKKEYHITDGINRKGAEFDKINDELVVNFGKEIPSNTYLSFKSFAKKYGKKILLIEESNKTGDITSNPKYIVHYYNYYSKKTYYKLSKSTQFIKIKMIKNHGGSIVVDYLEHQPYSILTDIDTDGDGIPNRLDLDSDGDGCSDALEACVPDIFKSYENPEDNDTISTLNEAIIKGNFGANGFSNNLEKTDNTNTESNFRDAYHYAINKDINACGTPMITQIVKSSSENWIEITNIHPTAIIPKNAILISLFKNSNDDLTGISPNEITRNPKELQPGESLVFKNGNSAIPLLNQLPFVNNLITNFSDSNSIITISRASNKLTWQSRIDVTKNIENTTAYVRIDEVTKPNKNYSSSEWVAFVNDNLDPYRDLTIGGPERHPHAPLFSEIISANQESNILLGLHRINPTERIDGAWSNGYPDRSRHVIVKEDYIENTNSFKARKLSVKNGSTLLMNNKLLVVTDSIHLLTNDDEIRLAQNAELIQTHKNEQQFYGLGKILIDKKTKVESIYRYSYLSSPVNSIGKNTYTIADVLNDGTIPLSIDSKITDINFVSGYNGEATSPISIADYWIYTFSSSNGTRANYEQKKSTGAIRQTSGFIMKGTGVLQNYTFVGSAKDGKLNSNIGAEDSYLLGNPYPSTISAKKFIEDNINSISGTLYFWQHAGEKDIETSNIAGHSFSGYIGGYATRNIAMGIAANLAPSNNYNTNDPTINDDSYWSPGNYIPVGTGFFVGGSKTGGPIVFNNSQREYKKNNNTESTENTSNNLLENVLDIFPVIDFKDPDALPILKLGMEYKEPEKPTIHRQIGISFNKNNSFKKEKGYDSELFDLNDTDIYWKFDNDESKYSIAGVQEISSDLEIPLELSLSYSGEISLGIDEKNQINTPIYLKDKVTDSIYDLSNKVKINLASGTYSNRFYLAFSKEKEPINTPVITTPKDYFNVYYNSRNKKIILNKKEEITVSKIHLYKLFRGKIDSWSIKNQRKKIKLKTRKRIRRGIYIIKIETEKGIFIEKTLVR